MAIIDADAHVLETHRTWEYMEGTDKAYRPQIVTSSDHAGGAGEYWLVDGRLHAKSDNVGHNTPEESREMSDVTSRLRHMDEMEVSMQVLYPTIFLRPVTDRPRWRWRFARATIAGCATSGRLAGTACAGPRSCRC